MTARKPRKPKVGKEPPARSVRRKAEPESYLKRQASWAIGRLDRGGKWGWNTISLDELWNEIISKLKNFELMTWAEIANGANSHNVPCDKLHREAQNRLRMLSLDDLDCLFSLRLASTKRIWGILENGVLKILWYDPNHEVCPVKLKHT